MPNDCYNNLTIGAEPEIIQMLVDCEFSFDKLRPRPNIFPTGVEDINEYLCKWSCENWGTKWDHSEHNIIIRGKKGLNIEFITPWVPPLELLKFLIDKYKIWVKCEWREEGGLAGIFVGQHNGEQSIIREFVWDDWCIEEETERMNF
jgi:hypothetical protein